MKSRAAPGELVLNVNGDTLSLVPDTPANRLTSGMEEVTPPSEPAEYQAYYSNLDMRFRALCDREFHIIWIPVKDEKEDKIIQIKRDAINQKELGDPSVNQYVIEENNMLLRVLGRLRSIDYVISELQNEEEKAPESDEKKQIVSIYSKQRTILFDKYKELRKTIEFSDKTNLEKYRKTLKALETTFNTEVLCDVLMKTDLNPGCYSASDYEALLFHYRNLSSVLDPAKSVVTMTYDEKNHVIHRRTEVPVTAKLPQQQFQNELAEVISFPADEQESFHTVQTKAIQIANKYFAPLMDDNERMLAAQMRKKHFHIRNTFLTAVEVVFLEKNFSIDAEKIFEYPALPQYTRSFIRGGTPVYIGKGETEERIQKATRDNMEQIRQFAKNQLVESKIISEDTELKIHTVGLVTDGIKILDRTKQKKMVAHMEKATELNADIPHAFSLASSNAEGLVHSIRLSDKAQKEITFTNTLTKLGEKIARKKDRIKQIATMFLEQMNHQFENFKKQEYFWIAHMWCASGQDRTGTAAELVVQWIIKQCYRNEGYCFESDEDKRARKVYANVSIQEESINPIEALSIGSRHTAMLASWMVGGSDGCKRDSLPKLVLAEGLFANVSNKAMYLKLANTNKSNHVDKNALNLLAKNIGKIAEIKLNRAIKAVNNLGCDVLPSPIKACAYFLITDALAVVATLCPTKFEDGKKRRTIRCNFERLGKIQKVLEADEIKEFSMFIFNFILEKAKSFIPTLPMPSSPQETLKGKLSQIPLAKLNSSDALLVAEGLVIADDLTLDPAGYRERYGLTTDDGYQRYIDIDLNKLCKIQQLLKHTYKHGAYLFLEFLGAILVLATISAALLFAITLPVSAGSSLLALNIAIKALATSHTIHYFAGLSLGLITGVACLFFGRKFSQPLATSQQAVQDFREVVSSRA